jgi:hypothetical protein
MTKSQFIWIVPQNCLLDQIKPTINYFWASSITSKVKYYSSIFNRTYISTSKDESTSSQFSSV